MQHLLAASVREANPFEAHVALDPRQVARSFPIEDFRLLVEHAHDLVERRRRGEERVVELGELLHGIEEVLDVEHEREERSQRQRAAEVEVPAVAEHNGERDRREQVDEREVEPVQDDGLHVRLAVASGHRAEVRVSRLLPRERLKHAHARDVLGERGSDKAEALSDRSVGACRPRPEDRGSDAHERQHRARCERKPPVQDEEDDRGAEQRERVLDEARHAVRDELVDRLHVVRQAADDHARAVSLVEAERELLKVLEEAVAEVGENPLADPAGEIGLDVGHAPVRETGGDEDRDDDVQLRPAVMLDRVVERVLRQVRRRERDRRNERSMQR